MQVYYAKNYALVRTYFDEKHDLIQKFRGLEYGASMINAPIDFMGAGLMLRCKWDCFHEDIPFTITTDEATPIYINNCFIGANHGHYCLIELYVPAHGKTLQDVGSVWRDENGATFYLIRVIDNDLLVVVSQNKGESIEKYEFTLKVEGKLTYMENGVNTADISPKSQTRADLVSANRYYRKRILAYKDGVATPVRDYAECDYVELQEEYDIINPATVAPAIAAARPSGGYTSQPAYNDFGTPMVNMKLCYRILGDGTVVCDFAINKLMDVTITRVMGVMHQEKQDVYGGGIWRYMPKLLPFVHKDGVFDYGKRIPISHEASYPRDGAITKEFWANPDSPCERAVDYFLDNDGNDKLAFATGFLPIFDGEPSIRKQHLIDTAFLKFTRKHYPTFMNGNVPSLRGIGYKKYFLPQRNGASYYTVACNGSTYIYVDIFQKNELTIPVFGTVQCLENEGLTYEHKNGEIVVRGVHGYAVFENRS